ncbi:NAD-dependent deacetylase [Thiopseudomonas alkaliphila]|uniref:SIR2 family NAD-dependent protein deacylase n=1 Tax=Thiopseudomonas alkaliphila TaxID=1697053 RepID=UPI003570B629
MQQSTLTLLNWLKQAKHTLVFSGAGMSTESGLPDFRSAERGLWKKFNPSELAHVRALEHNRDEFTAFYQARLADINQYQPHNGHYILARWEQHGLLQGIITQNVDGFHGDAGSQQVLELHGSFRDLHCHSCGAAMARHTYLTGSAYCPCGGTVRPGIVLFGETLPQDTFQRAEQLTRACDLFIVLGSSLSVSPANGFPHLAKQMGAKLVIINYEPTDMDYLADLVINQQSIKGLLESLNQQLTAA